MISSPGSIIHCKLHGLAGTTLHNAFCPGRYTRIIAPMDSKIVNFSPRLDTQTIIPGQVVTIKYALLRYQDRSVLEYREQLHYLQDGHATPLPKLQQALAGRRVGEKIEVSLKAVDAFGEHSADWLMQIPRHEIPAEAQSIGTQLTGEAPDGSERLFTVVKINDDTITVDGNHPFAGEDVIFVVEIHSLRTASERERELGFALAQVDTTT